MSTTRRFSMFDLLKFNNVNLDPLTETYNMSFYTQYLAKWPEYCFNVTAAQGRPMGYILGKAEGLGEEWHGHVTAVTVPPEYRRLGVAAQLMDMLERVSEWDKGYFVDLFVRESNALAIGMYKKLGYSVYRQAGAARAELWRVLALRARSRAPRPPLHACTGHRLLQRRGRRVRHAQGALARPREEVLHPATKPGVP
jgi:N-terminal acetyltransferase B complex catalytic subunit